MNRLPKVLISLVLVGLLLLIATIVILPRISWSSSGTKFWWTESNAMHIAGVLKAYHERHHQLPAELMTLCKEGDASPRSFTSPFSDAPIAFRYSPVGWPLPGEPEHRVLLYCTANMPAVVNSPGGDPHETYAPAVDAEFNLIRLTFEQRDALNAMPVSNRVSEDAADTRNPKLETRN